MTFRVIVTPRALADIEANAGWWAANHSEEQARRWIDAMHNQLQSLSTFPETNGLSVENGGFPYEIRDKLLGVGSRPSHRAVFTIKDDAVYVLTVRHAARDVVRPGEIEFPPSA